MKNTTTIAKRAALITVLALGSTWLNAQQTNQGQYGQPGSGLDRQQNKYGTNSQYNQGQSGQTTGQNRQGNYGAYGTNSQYNQGQSGQTTGQNRQGSFGAYGTNSQYNQGQSGQAEAGLGRQQESFDASGTNSQALQVTKINKGSAIIGATVKNQQGESLGKIRDLVIDFNSGQVAYIVLDSETGLFNAAKLHAVPLRAFQPDAEGTSLILKTDKTQLDSSEGFAKDNWPGAATATWGAEPNWKDQQGTSQSLEDYDADRQHTNDVKVKTYKDTKPEPKRSQPQP